MVASTRIGSLLLSSALIRTLYQMPRNAARGRAKRMRGPPEQQLPLTQKNGVTVKVTPFSA